jgi:hypothetical protein
MMRSLPINPAARLRASGSLVTWQATTIGEQQEWLQRHMNRYRVRARDEIM